MDGVAPTLVACSEIRMALERGSSMRLALVSYLFDFKDDCSELLESSLLFYDQGRSPGTLFEQGMSGHRRVLLQLIWAGFDGEPVLQSIRELENELIYACEQELDRHLALVPLKALLPLMLLQMPGFFILLFGPLLDQFLKGL